MTPKLFPLFRSTPDEQDAFYRYPIHGRLQAEVFVPKCSAQLSLWKIICSIFPISFTVCVLLSPINAVAGRSRIDMVLLPVFVMQCIRQFNNWTIIPLANVM